MKNALITGITGQDGSLWQYTGIYLIISGTFKIDL